MRNYILTIMSLCLIFGCDRPKTIPDDDLQQILQEYYLINAYCSSKAIVCDTVDVYQPVLKKYGYTVGDLEYTLSNFTKRKSSRLSDVIDQAINGLDREFFVYNHAVQILDTIDMIAAERMKTIVRQDSIIRVTSMRDTSKLKMKFAAEPGRYKIEYYYKTDSSDMNYGIRGVFNTLNVKNRTLTTNNAWMQRNNRAKVSVELASDTAARNLEVVLARYINPSSEPSITIDSLYIVHYPTREKAIEALNNSLLDYKLMIDGKEYDYCTADSLSLGVNPPRVVEKSVDRR